MKILSGRLKKPFPSDVKAQQEQPCCLEKTPGIHSPQQTGLLPQRNVAPDELPKVAGFRAFCHFRIHFAHLEVGQPVSRVGQSGQIVVPFNRLQQKYDGGNQNSLVTPVTRKEQDLTHHNEQQQDIAGRKECGIQRGKTYQQHHAPQETVTEVFPPPLLILRLNIKSKTKQKGKDGVCLTCKKAKHHIQNPLVQNLQPLR